MTCPKHRMSNKTLDCQDIKKEWCIIIIENPIKVEPQENNRFRFWGVVDDLEGRVLRVVTLEDRKTIHNAFPDRGYKP